MFSFRTYRLVAAAAVALAAAPVLAQAAPLTPADAAIDVSTRGLDLGTARGVAAMKARIRAASKSVCQKVFAPDTSSDAVRDCRIEAARDAMPALQSAIHLAETDRAGVLQMSANAR